MLQTLTRPRRSIVPHPLNAWHASKRERAKPVKPHDVIRKEDTAARLALNDMGSETSSATNIFDPWVLTLTRFSKLLTPLHSS